MANNNKILYEIQPHFNIGAIVTSKIPQFLFFVVWCGGFGIGLSRLFTPLIIFALIPWIALFIYPFLAYLSYKNTFYTLYKDHMEYTEGFLTQNLKSLPQKKMVSIHLSKNVIQRMCGIGTIQIEVYSGDFISLRDIKDPEETFEYLKKLYKL